VSLVIKFEAGLRPVIKHGTHDQSTHGNWAIGRSDAWSVETKANETTLSQERDRTLLKVTIPNKLLSDSKYKESVESALTTIEKLHTDYPINTEVKFRDGELEEAKFLAQTWSTNMVYGVVTTQTSQINIAKRFFSEDREVQTHTLTHEWGHAVDSRPKDVAKQQADKLSLAMFNDDSIPMTDYGYTSDREAYAEAFAIKVNNSHKGGIYSSRVQQNPKWEEVFKIFDLDSLKKALGERVSFKVWDTFDANNPPKLIEDYDPTVQKHQEHDQSSHGNWATGQKGGSGLSHREMFELKKQPDPMVRKVYEAEEKNHNQIQDKNADMPSAPNRTQFTNYADYDEAYKQYSKDFTAWSKKVTTSLISPLGQKHLDGTPRGVNGYVRDVLRQDWFVEAFGKGGVAGNNLEVKVSSANEAGAYQIGFKGDLPVSILRVSRGYSKAEPTIVHEIAHYATTISATSPHGGHGVEFARNHIFITSKLFGASFADGLEKSYREAGVPLGD
jgi:hypothetical protein